MSTSMSALSASSNAHYSGVQMFGAVFRIFGFGKKPPQAESVPETTTNLIREAPKHRENTALPIPSAAQSASLDESSDEYEDETYTFAADVKDSENKKRSIMAFHNPSSPENHISWGFATDLGFPIAEPPYISSVEVSWSSSSLCRLDETTRFIVAKSESFKLLFGREDKRQRHGEKDSMEHPRPIGFREAVKNGIMYPLELADSDNLELGSDPRGPKVADVEARLQPNHSFLPVSLLERYIEQPDQLNPSPVSLGTGSSTLGPKPVTSKPAQTDHTRGLGSESWEYNTSYTSPRKPMQLTSSTATTTTQVSTASSTNPYAVLQSLDSDSSNATSSKKQKKKRKSSKKPNRLAEQHVDTRLSIPKEEVRSIYYPSALSTFPEDNYTASASPIRRSVTSDFGESNYHDPNEEMIPRSEEDDQEGFKENLEVKLPSETLFTLSEIAQDAGDAGPEAPKQWPQTQEQMKKGASRKK